jgi:hypothetical protein
MGAYGKVFLRKYENLVQRKVRPAYQKYFQFLKGKPILINASISTSHGAAVEFIPSEVHKFQCQTVTTRIEHAVFPNKNSSISGIEDFAKSNPGFRVSAKLFGLKNYRIVTKNRPFVELMETGSFRTEEIVVDDIDYPNTIIIKGSNRRNAWSRKAAKEEALSDFRGDFFFAYHEREDFREFVATPKLTLMAKEIDAKEKDGGYGGEYGCLEKEEDIAKFNEAADALGVSHKRAEKVYKHVKAQPRWRERNPTVFNVICGVVGGFLVILLILFFKWGWKWIMVKLDG